MDLADAIATADWPVALRSGLDLWRATRDPMVARLVDRIDVRIALPQPPAGNDLHAWWMQHARAYDPVIATSLIGHIGVRARGRDVRWRDATARWPDAAIFAAVGRDDMGDATNVLERMAALERWPDDPRLARVLARWLTGPTRFVRDGKQVHVVRWLGAQLARIGDVRIVPQLEAARAAEPAVVTTLLAALARVPRRPADVERLLAIVDEPTQIEQLWHRAAHDREARGVLADALVAHGESRGTYLALARSGNPSHARKAARLLAKNWERWLGPDLALLAVHDGTEFHDGMIEVLRAGHYFTPPWTWDAVVGHHELSVVHTVRPGDINLAVGAYARFLTQLPQLRTVHSVSLETLAALVAIDARLPVTDMTILQAGGIDAGVNKLALVARARTIAPALRRLGLPRPSVTDEVRAAYPDLVSISS